MEVLESGPSFRRSAVNSDAKLHQGRLEDIRAEILSQLDHDLEQYYQFYGCKTTTEQEQGRGRSTTRRWTRNSHFHRRDEHGQGEGANDELVEELREEVWEMVREAKQQKPTYEPTRAAPASNPSQTQDDEFQEDSLFDSIIMFDNLVQEIESQPLPAPKQDPHRLEESKDNYDDDPLQHVIEFQTRQLHDNPQQFYFDDASMLRIQIYGSKHVSMLYIPISLIFRREQEMNKRARRFGISKDRWNGSLLFQQFELARRRRRQRPLLNCSKPNEKDDDDAIVLFPESDCAKLNYSHSLAWQSWMTAAIQSYYIYGTLQVPDQCCGHEILLALQYFNILYSPSKLKFESLEAFGRVKFWSEYFSHRATLAAWVEDRIAAVMQQQSCYSNKQFLFIFCPVTAKTSNHCLIRLGMLPADIFDGGLVLDPAIYDNASSQDLVDSFFNGEAGRGELEHCNGGRTDALMRQDFVSFLNNALPAVEVSFPMRLVSIRHPKGGEVEQVRRAVLLVNVDDSSDQSTVAPSWSLAGQVSRCTMSPSSTYVRDNETLIWEMPSDERNDSANRKDQQMGHVESSLAACFAPAVTLLSGNNVCKSQYRSADTSSSVASFYFDSNSLCKSQPCTSTDRRVIPEPTSSSPRSCRVSSTSCVPDGSVGQSVRGVCTNPMDQGLIGKPEADMDLSEDNTSTTSGTNYETTSFTQTRTTAQDNESDNTTLDSLSHRISYPKGDHVYEDLLTDDKARAEARATPIPRIVLQHKIPPRPTKYVDDREGPAQQKPQRKERRGPERRENREEEKFNTAREHANKAENRPMPSRSNSKHGRQGASYGEPPKYQFRLVCDIFGLCQPPPGPSHGRPVAQVINTGTRLSSAVEKNEERTAFSTTSYSSSTMSSTLRHNSYVNSITKTNERPQKDSSTNKPGSVMEKLRTITGHHRTVRFDVESTEGVTPTQSNSHSGDESASLGRAGIVFPDDEPPPSLQSYSSTTTP